MAAVKNMGFGLLAAVSGLRARPILSSIPFASSLRQLEPEPLGRPVSKAGAGEGERSLNLLEMAPYFGGDQRRPKARNWSPSKLENLAFDFWMKSHICWFLVGIFLCMVFERRI